MRRKYGIGVLLLILMCCCIGGCNTEKGKKENKKQNIEEVEGLAESAKEEQTGEEQAQEEQSQKEQAKEEQAQEEQAQEEQAQEEKTKAEEQDTEDTEEVPEEYMITTENEFAYQSGMECAAFSSAYVLRHFGEEADGMELYEDYPSKLPSGGVMPDGIVAFFTARDYSCEFVMNGTVEELKKQVSQGIPVIVFIHMNYPYDSCHNTHYVPMVGYDNEFIYLAESVFSYANCWNEEGLSYNRKVEIDYFENLWRNIDGVWQNPYFIIQPKNE